MTKGEKIPTHFMKGESVIGWLIFNEMVVLRRLAVYVVLRNGASNSSLVRIFWSVVEKHVTFRVLPKRAGCGLERKGDSVGVSSK